MSRKIIYRKQLLQAIEAFLYATPSTITQAQHIIQRCYAEIMDESKNATLDAIIWGFFIVALTDSVYYEDEKFLQEAREILRGHSSQNIARTVFSDDYRLYFTPDETEWYTQLQSMLDFLMVIPFAEIYEATHQTKQTTEATTSDIFQLDNIDEEYRRLKAIIEDISVRSPLPEDVGDEKIYHLVLREVTGILMEIKVGKAAAHFGYPIFEGSYTTYGGLQSSKPKPLDMTQRLVQARRFLDAISGKGDLFISWRLSKASTFNSDVLFISLY